MLLTVHKIDPFADTDETLTPSNSEVNDRAENPIDEPTKPASELASSEIDEIHYLVSSRHLMLASPWFRRPLTSDRYIEALKDPSDGRYHIQANGWDEEALLILLNIFHVLTRLTPATVSLEMLAQIVVLVYYYELENAEVMERDTVVWIANVKRTVAIPSSYCRDLMLWICISGVFNMSEEFEKATAVAVKDSTGWIQTLDLPIHQEITSSIEHSRCNALEHIISELHRQLEVYRDFDYFCPNHSYYSFQCGVFLFGALTKYMERWIFLSPRPEQPFLGISLNGIANMVKDMERLQQNHHLNNCCGGGYNQLCNLNSKIGGVIQNALTEVKGLKS
ncbi:hypothetical protein K505DRAFT_351891 [Melanomma pulvis-pyrius CBS 109.77]|uniref:BTB domain-containing protein n=1 Tax=Melanomma pulvis-pyrius CBS 109.77 TaxID=1314802 RepID=A0A6A6X2D4_9PLEO|nr:hypothetical protein K505DRAFT_351891 [Melanomma pulvis-pyrius CBS 109.77]